MAAAILDFLHNGSGGALRHQHSSPSNFGGMPTRKAPPVAALIRELRLIRHRYTPDATAAKLALLTAAATAGTRTLAQVVRLHEDLLFLRAFPDSEEVRALAGTLLGQIERRVRALPHAARARL